ncbi:MAG: zinc ribbon domain-containing protein [Methylophilaceae bacterium]|nr:zinc ribbon domain-containing protein [Methylophilaceae bacterium]
MPIYDYQCASCGFGAELLRKAGEADALVCPECGAHTFTKQLSAPYFQLSGSGWYATDFKAKPADTTPADTSKPSSAESSAPTAQPCANPCNCH